MYVLTLTQLQQDFYNALFAPFRDDELSQVPARGSKKVLTYLDKRALENRLDTVCGPHGWTPRYEATARGYKCTLSILVPSAASDPNLPADERNHWRWVDKEDGAGFEEMGSNNRQTGEWEADVDNDEKSGYTNALRRAAQDAWGIGRYLYNKGIPGFLDPGNMPLTPARPRTATPVQEQHPSTIEQMTRLLGAARGMQDPEPPREEITHRQRDVPVESPTTEQLRAREEALLGPISAPVVQEPAANLAPKTNPVKPMQIPRTGKSIYSWAKLVEQHFDESVTQGMASHGKDLGLSHAFADWDEASTRTVCLGVVAHLMHSPKYAGEFDHLKADIASQPERAPAQKPGPAGVNIADLRKTLLAKMTGLIGKQTGRIPTDADRKAMFMEIAPMCQSSHGLGLVPESLSNLSDAVWITSMIKFVDDQIAHVMSNQTAPETTEIPF